MSQTPIYMDYAATTPVDESVAALMCECLTREGNFGNPASRSHVYGWRAEEAVETARGQVAGLINADPREIIWTSGATESNNLALKGALKAAQTKESREGRQHIVVSAVEHKSVLDTALALEELGVELSWIAPDAQGHIDVEKVCAAITENTVLVSVMHANNEVGAINDIATLGRYCREHGVLLHSDAAQSAGKIDVDVKALNVDFLSLSAHKLYGPKGIGALYVRRSPEVKIAAQIHGGGHERGMRSGTLPTHQIAGFGLAAELAMAKLESEFARQLELKRRFWQGLKDLHEVELNGSIEASLPGITNLSFKGVDAETLLMSLRNLALSSGSACTSASLEPSYVLKAMGRSAEQAHSSLRFSFGRYTSENDVDTALNLISESLATLVRKTAS